MSDFHQRGLISTLPRLQPRPLDDLEKDLTRWSQENPVALILPCTLDDLRRPALRQILEQLKNATWLSQIVISLNLATATDLSEINKTLAAHGDPRISLLWNDHPALPPLLAEIGIAPASGKGFNLWSALGWLLHKNKSRLVLTHDSDILHYTRELPALLAYPLLHPDFGYRFCKGYYPRLSGHSRNGEKQDGQLFGRVTRLFVGPLLRALVRVEGHHPLLDFLESFRYPLAGEFAAPLSWLADCRLPTGWDLEIDLLCSTHRHLSPESIVQIDLGSNYEHKHQPLLPGQRHAGLHRLASEIATCLLVNLAREGASITPDFLHALRLAYAKSARETIRRYRHVAQLNQLTFHEDRELALVEEFTAILTQPSAPRPTSLPAWSELRRSHPDGCAKFYRLLGG